MLPVPEVLPAPEEVPVPEAVPLVEPVVPLVDPDVLDESGVVLEVDPIEEDDDESNVPVTWTRLPTCFESLSLSLEISL